ncbi:hypothetical protein [Bartonella senegalensis]|uniref:hypothetical protein n=1 Tax=Bartonella senegalensis TaxID=1468418 RepID=UPI0002F42B85|nr:hypothetical protein [Bartonella senegalensis]
MTIASLMMLVATNALTLHPTAISVVAAQKFSDHICATSINNNPKVSYHFSSFEKAIVKGKKFEQFGHNFDISLRQISVRNLKFFGMSPSDLFDHHQSLEAAHAPVANFSERKKSEQNFEKNMLQSILSFYNAESLKGALNKAYVQEVVSHIGMQVSARFGKKPQESLELHADQSKQAIEIETLPPSSEDLEDAFTHKTSSVGDAFTAGDFSSTAEISSSPVR